jgi:hypothetical protein
VKGIIVNPRGVEVPEHVPVLDSHRIANGVLGHLASAWVENDLLMGELVFTGSAGRRAFQAIERGSLGGGISCRFETVNFEIFDADGDVFDIEDAVARGPDDPDLVVIAQRSILREVSITATPADRNAFVRAVGFDAECWRMIKQGEEELRRILYSDGDGVYGNMQNRGWRRVELPPLVVQYGAPEAFCWMAREIHSAA